MDKEVEGGREKERIERISREAETRMGHYPTNLVDD